MNNKIFTGIIFSILVAGIVIYAIEIKASWIQMIIGFLLYIFPFTFINCFKSRRMVFLLTLISIMTIYVSYKCHYRDIWSGILLVAILGFGLYFFRVRQFKPFSKDKYNKLL